MKRKMKTLVFPSSWRVELDIRDYWHGMLAAWT